MGATVQTMVESQSPCSVLQPAHYRELDSQLTDVDKRAEGMFLRLVEEMAEREGVTESLKASDMMAWVGRMNNIRQRATEIVTDDILTI